MPFILSKDPFLVLISPQPHPLSRLDLAFGEFNSGKSTVINTLLGNDTLMRLLFLQQMRSLSYATPRVILKSKNAMKGIQMMNIVDTPGTNVILQRQQCLTEEFVPHADLLLFVISADKPLTESEVAFLRYIQQWKKKVIFMLNKSDLYQNSSELEEAILFIKENTRKLLNTDDMILYPISARSALEAKLSASSHTGKEYSELLVSESHLKFTRFYEL
ncbi:hypothetical protein H0E87_004105 [Populus deltoides]|uniref:G domain-containing protein n=1 Tax=Populus deltoides TaxID=3696 RepID=A0A8T2ZDK1_POPDE|nr:hypothetical protein H0E87_004105 [Populus deltoides]